MPYITGPAIVIRGGASIYFRDGLTVTVNTQTGEVPSDFHGTVDTFLRSRSITISGRPEGMIANLSQIFGLGVANVGASIFGASDTALVIHTKAGQTITYERSGISKMPSLKLSATDDFFGDAMEWTCLGDPTTEPTDAAHWKTIVTSAFADVTYSETTKLRYRYTAAYGSTPYDAMTAQEGFTISLNQTNEEISDDNVGLADIVLRSLTATCNFVPSNLTEAQVDGLIKLQGSGAVLIGESIAKGATDLVITGDNGPTSFTATLHKAGFGQSAYMYQTGRLRAGEVQALTRRTWSTGVANPLYTFAIGT